MAIDLRAVVDTNVVVSAVQLAGSVPRRAFDAAVQSGRLLYFGRNCGRAGGRAPPAQV
jgi:hypothetical protein